MDRRVLWVVGQSLAFGDFGRCCRQISNWLMIDIGTSKNSSMFDWHFGAASFHWVYVKAKRSWHEFILSWADRLLAHLWPIRTFVVKYQCANTDVSTSLPWVCGKTNQLVFNMGNYGTIAPLVRVIINIPVSLLVSYFWRLPLMEIIFPGESAEEIPPLWGLLIPGWGSVAPWAPLGAGSSGSWGIVSWPKNCRLNWRR